MSTPVKYRTDQELIDFLRAELRFAAAVMDDIGRPNTASRLAKAAETKVIRVCGVGVCELDEGHEGGHDSRW